MDEPPFPPTGSVSNCKIIPSYLYEQYYDDDDLQAFVTAYNQMAQDYLSWFCDANLPIYTNDYIAGDLLDWMAEGLYGFPRPTVSSGSTHAIGPLNTWFLNPVGLPLNASRVIGHVETFVTTDDIYKRFLTWLFYKGDGFQFSILWLKRRIMRFLTGPNGTDPPVGDTSPISVTMTSDRHVTIVITVGGDISLPDATILQAAIPAAFLGMPFQYTYTVNLA